MISDYEVGSHYSKRGFNCLECAERCYDELEDVKYLAECEMSCGRSVPSKILRNTYGWKNE